MDRRPETDGSFMERETLINTINELKHRLCLFEYGLGKIALIAKHNAVSVDKNQLNPASESAWLKVREVLHDITVVLKAVQNNEVSFDSAESIRYDYSNENMTVTPAVSQTGRNTKVKIFIDETPSGVNSLTTMFSNATTQPQTEVKGIRRDSHRPERELDALSTLAAVATTTSQDFVNCMTVTDLNNYQSQMSQLHHLDIINLPAVTQNQRIISQSDCGRQKRSNIGEMK